MIGFLSKNNCLLFCLQLSGNWRFWQCHSHAHVMGCQSSWKYSAWVSLHVCRAIFILRVSSAIPYKMQWLFLCFRTHISFILIQTMKMAVHVLESIKTTKQLAFKFKTMKFRFLRFLSRFLSLIVSKSFSLSLFLLVCFLKLN